MAKELIGILMAAAGNGGIIAPQEMSEDERMKYFIVKVLNEDYRNRTFGEVAEYMIKDRDTLPEPEQKVIADKVRSFMRQHDPPNFVCYFIAYDADCTTIKNQNGRDKIGLNEKIMPYITKRQHNGMEYDCIDMLAVALCC